MVDYRVGCVGNQIWHVKNLLRFLSANQNKSIRLAIDPEAVCLHTVGLYEILDQFQFKNVEILTANPFEKHPKYQIIFLKWDMWFHKISDVSKTLHTWNKKKIFFCLFGRPSAARLGLAAYLQKNYCSKTLIHFSATVDADNLIQFELNKLLSYRLDSIKESGILIKQLPILLSNPSGYTSTNGYGFEDPLTNFYKDILIDIVVESHVAGDTFFPTEKTLRSIILKKPFIIFSSKNYLDYLHQIGFRTFCDFWPEIYDGYEGKNRFEQILILIDFISSKSIEELEHMYWDMQCILNHNYQLLLTKKYARQIKYIE